MTRFLSVRKGSRPNAIDVSRYGKAPWNRLSPFHLYEACIPLPGTYGYQDLIDKEFVNSQPGRSVEGIWQGLKRIQGQTDPTMLLKQARKRRGRPEGHEFGYRLLGYDEAKALIYIPSYLYVLTELEDSLVAELRTHEGEVALVDVSYQPDCLGPRPISHAALLADFLNGQLEPYQRAHASLLDLARRMSTKYNVADPGESRWVDVEMIEIKRRVLQLSRIELLDYQACADLFEREILMMTAIRSTGCHSEVERAKELLDAWVEAGVLSQPQADELSHWAPVCRWTDDWYRATGKDG